MSKEAVYEFVMRADSDPDLGYAVRGVAGIPAIVRVAAERGFRFTADELAPVLDLLRFLDNASRDAWLRGELASARDHEAVVALGHGRGYKFSSDELAHLNVAPASGQLADRDLDRVVGGASINRQPEAGIRISLNTTVVRQTPKTDFGSVLAAGMNTAVPGASIAAPFVPGAAVVSAAVGGTSDSD